MTDSTPSLGGKVLNLGSYLEGCSQQSAQASAMQSLVLPGCRCLALKPELFAQDYPQIWRNLGQSTSALKRWLEQQFAVVATGQIQHGSACCQAAVKEEDCRIATVFRQQRMGRTSVVPLELNANSPILECKGCGVAEGLFPSLQEYSSGLLSLECGIHEYLMSCILDRQIPVASDWRVARIYAILLLDITMAWGTDWIHAALLVREPTVRPQNTDLPAAYSREWEIGIEMEFFLRSQALTSCFSDQFVIKTVGSELVVSHWYAEAERESRFLKSFLDVLQRSSPFCANRLNVQVNRGLHDAKYCVVDLEHIKPRHLAAPGDLINLAAEQPYLFGGLIPSTLLDQIQTDERREQVFLQDFAMQPCTGEIYRLLKYAQRHGAQETFGYKKALFSTYLACSKTNDFTLLGEQIENFAHRWR